MAAVKTNERPGTRARASYLRGSAYKAREVLDLIRGRSCVEAREILAFSERDVAQDIAKVLESAVANAEHNDGLDGDEMFVSACYADEGPTLKRWRPRARGRATRIRKRTCHITVIVSQYDAETLDELRSRRSSVGAQPAQARRRRVARSRAAETSTAAATDESAPDETESEGTEPEEDVSAQAAAVVQATEEALASSDGIADAEEAAEGDHAEGAPEEESDEAGGGS